MDERLSLIFVKSTGHHTCESEANVGLILFFSVFFMMLVRPAPNGQYMYTWLSVCWPVVLLFSLTKTETFQSTVHSYEAYLIVLANAIEVCIC